MTLMYDADGDVIMEDEFVPLDPHPASFARRDGTCFIWNLPRELRDEIYRFSYSGDELYYIRPVSYEPKLHSRFQDTGLLALIVNRQYFAEAAPMFYRSKAFAFRRDTHSLHFLRTDSFAKENIKDITLPFPPAAEQVESGLITQLNQCPRLEDVCIFVDLQDVVRAFPIGQGRSLDAWVHECFAAIAELRGLQRFRLVSSGLKDCSHRDRAGVAEMFDDLDRQLQRVCVLRK